VPEERTTLSDRERELVQQIADQWGVSFEEAADRLRREGLEQRVRRKVGRAPAKVYAMPRRTS
jgi:predicted transcriptional regulator